MSNSPDEADELARDGSDDDRCFLSASEHSSISTAEPDLGFPCNVEDFGRNSLVSLAHRLTDLGRHSVGPGRFHDEPACDDASCLRDSGRSACLSARILARHQPETRHELPWTVEPSHVTDFSNHAGGDDERNAAKSLQRLDDRSQGPIRQEFQDLPFDGLFALDGLIHCVDVSLECDLLRRMFEALIAEPNAMLLLPDCSNISATVAQQEAPNALSGLADILGGNLASPDEIAHGFVRLVRNPNCRKLSGARQAR